MRGKVASIGGLSMPRGIIPAHAGKRPSLSLIADARGDHPRSCGEKGGIALGLVAAVGSSPLMRGKEPQNYAQHLKRGIIPAHAGKRDGPLGPVSAIRDHPRSCGEKQITRFSVGTRLGSSPLMRGKETTFPMVRRPAGIIPAHAGKSTGWALRSSRTEDHPRSCG